MHVHAAGAEGEKVPWPQNSDASSGQVETVEQALGSDSELVDKATERAVLRKLDYRIVPMVMWVYLMNMMDRGTLSFIHSTTTATQPFDQRTTTVR